MFGVYNTEIREQIKSLIIEGNLDGLSSLLHEISNKDDITKSDKRILINSILKYLDSVHAYAVDHVGTLSILELVEFSSILKNQPIISNCFDSLYNVVNKDLSSLNLSFMIENSQSKSFIKVFDNKLILKEKRLILTLYHEEKLLVLIDGFILEKESPKYNLFLRKNGNYLTETIKDAYLQIKE